MIDDKNFQEIIQILCSQDLKNVDKVAKMVELEPKLEQIDLDILDKVIMNTLGKAKGETYSPKELSIHLVLNNEIFPINVKYLKNQFNKIARITPKANIIDEHDAETIASSSSAFHSVGSGRSSTDSGLSEAIDEDDAETIASSASVFHSVGSRRSSTDSASSSISTNIDPAELYANRLASIAVFNLDGSIYNRGEMRREIDKIFDEMGLGGKDFISSPKIDAIANILKSRNPDFNFMIGTFIQDQAFGVRTSEETYKIEGDSLDTAISAYRDNIRKLGMADENIDDVMHAYLIKARFKADGKIANKGEMFDATVKIFTNLDDAQCSKIVKKLSESQISANDTNIDQVYTQSLGKTFNRFLKEIKLQYKAYKCTSPAPDKTFTSQNPYLEQRKDLSHKGTYYKPDSTDIVPGAVRKTSR